MFWNSESHAVQLEWTLREPQSDKLGALRQAQDKLQVKIVAQKLNYK